MEIYGQRGGGGKGDDMICMARRNFGREAGEGGGIGWAGEGRLGVGVGVGVGVPHHQRGVSRGSY